MCARKAGKAPLPAEVEVLRTRGQLERRVEEPTAELARISAELAQEIERRRQAEEGRREVLRRLITAEEVERRRVSRELHDQMGQQLTGLLLGLRAAKKEAEKEAGTDATVVRRLTELERLAGAIARDVQHLALELRPPAVDNLGLKAALQNHLEQWGQRHGISYDFHAVGLNGEELSAEVETTLYRGVQEGLTNVLKHAGATHVSLVLERRDGIVSAILEDNGCGFDPEEVLASPEKSRRLGLRGIRERVALVGGEMEVESSPGSGTTLFVRVREPGAAREPASREEGT